MQRIYIAKDLLILLINYFTTQFGVLCFTHDVYGSGLIYSTFFGAAIRGEILFIINKKTPGERRQKSQESYIKPILIDIPILFKYPYVLLSFLDAVLTKQGQARLPGNLNVINGKGARRFTSAAL